MPRVLRKCVLETSPTVASEAAVCGVASFQFDELVAKEEDYFRSAWTSKRRAMVHACNEVQRSRIDLSGL